LENEIVVTDGCGFIRESFLNKNLKNLNLKPTSAIQIRMGGWKGVLLKLRDEYFETGVDVMVWESMWKFDCNFENQTLDLIKTADYMKLYLNC